MIMLFEELERIVKEQIPDSGMNEQTYVFRIKLLNESCFSDQ